MIEDLKYKVNAFGDCLHVHLEGCTINIIRTGEFGSKDVLGYHVDLWPPQPYFLDSPDPLGSFSVSDSQIQEDINYVTS